MSFIDLSLLKQEDIKIISPTGEQEYNIPGNISTDFYITMVKVSEDIKKIDASKDFESIVTLLKETVLAILQLDPAKEGITLDTLKEQQFDSFDMLNAVFSGVMEQMNKAANSKNSNSPKSN